MTRAFHEIYLSGAANRMGAMLHYAVNDCGIDIDEFFVDFLISGLSWQFERGNPAVIAGASGIELAREALRRTYRHRNDEFPEPSRPQGKSPEYWTGWALAHYQWLTSKSFGSIHRVVPVSEMHTMYPLYHEMDVSQFADEINRRIEDRRGATNLKRIRENKGLSQTELSRVSGIGLRSIQMYEQRVNDIDRAQAQAVYKLAKALDCSIEDLLENPAS